MGADGFSMNFDTDAGGGIDLDRLLAVDGAGGGEELTDEQKAEAARRAQYDTDLESAKTANAALAKQLNTVLTEVEQLKARRSFDTTVDGSGAPAPPFDPVKFKAEMAKLAVEDPGEYALRLIAATDAISKANAAAATNGLGASTTSLEIKNYVNARAVADPDFRDAQDEFNELLAQEGAVDALAKAPPEMRKKTLDLLADAAMGRANKRKQNGDTRQRATPEYSGGMSVALGTEVPITLNGKQLNAVQREILRSAQEAGITDKKRLKAMVEDAAGDN